MLNRRDAIWGAMGAAALGAARTTLASADPKSAAAPPAVEARANAKAPLAFLMSEPLVDNDRLRFFLRQAGLDAVVVAEPANVMYLTNHWPQLDRMGFTGSAIAVYPTDPHLPIAIVMHAFLWYYTHSPESLFTDRLVFPYTNPVEPGPSAHGIEPAAAPGRTMKVRDPSLMSARDRQRGDALSRARPTSADASWALTKALRELKLDKARLGIDNPELRSTLASRGMPAELVPAENVLRQTRLVKSATEMRLMRLAAQNNMEAAMAAANAARRLGSTRLLRARFFAEAAERGNSGVFMVINGTSTEVLDEPIVEGDGFSIDCVSTCRFYHGDFARTVFVGEPALSVKVATTAIARAWDDIRAQLTPGMAFADIPRLGRASLKSQGVDLNVGFTPHSVGLFHTDHPQPSLLSPRAPETLVLEENMVLSVDCPVFESGLGGTMHLEDLVVIRKGGAEPIHDVPPGVVIV